MKKDGLIWGACESPFFTPMHALTNVQMLLFCCSVCPYGRSIVA